MTEIKVWSWRQVIVSASNISPTTKHVLLTLSVYMNDLGGGCFPSIDKLSADTGLTCKSVIGALNMAELAGFITKTQHGFKGQEWKRNEYTAAYPETDLHFGIIPQSKTASDRQKLLARKRVVSALQSGELEKQPCCVCDATNTEAHHVDYNDPLNVFWVCREHHQRITHLERRTVKKVVNEVHHDEKGGECSSEGGEPASHKVVNEVHTNSTYNSSLNSSNKRAREKIKIQKPKPGDLQIEIPGWMPKEEWDAFVEMRKHKKKPLTPYAAQLIFRELEKLNSRGDPPDLVLQQSIINEWLDVFPLRNKTGNPNKIHANQHISHSTSIHQPSLEAQRERRSETAAIMAERLARQRGAATGDEAGNQGYPHGFQTGFAALTDQTGWRLAGEGT